jgi:TetR/AcrR family fatty acid metabolism transcriptional regulator
VRTKTSCQSEKILAAAAQLFGTQQFHEVRMDDIADTAEVGKGTLYRYFKDKDELYLAVLDWDAEQYLTRLRSVAQGHATATSQLIALVRAIIDHFDEQPHLLALIQRAEVTRTSDESFSWLQVRSEALYLVAEVFQRAEANNEFRIVDPELATTMLFGGLRSVIRFGPMPRPPDLAERIVHSFLTGAAR